MATLILLYVSLSFAQCSVLGVSDCFVLGDSQIGNGGTTHNLNTYGFEHESMHHWSSETKEECLLRNGQW